MPIVARKEEVVRAGNGFRTLEIIRFTSDMNWSLSIAPLMVITLLAVLVEQAKVAGELPPISTISQLSDPLRANSGGKVTVMADPEGTAIVFHWVFVTLGVN